jgi:hypothetical protein
MFSWKITTTCLIGVFVSYWSASVCAHPLVGIVAVNLTANKALVKLRRYFAIMISPLGFDRLRIGKAGRGTRCTPQLPDLQIQFGTREIRHSYDHSMTAK